MRLGDIVETTIGWARADAGLSVLPPLLMDAGLIVVLGEENGVAGVVTEDEVQACVRGAGIRDALHPSVIETLQRAGPAIRVADIARIDVVCLPACASLADAARALLASGDGFVIALADDGSVLGGTTRVRLVEAVAGMRHHVRTRRAG